MPGKAVAEENVPPYEEAGLQLAADSCIPVSDFEIHYLHYTHRYP
jgi:hypothetical protein